MSENSLRDVLIELERLRFKVAVLERGKIRSRRSRRLFSLLIVTLLIALTPLSLLAANPFNDLVPGSVHNSNIDAIYNAGITTGCVPNQSYCPTDLVTRQEMASFLARTAGIGGNPAVTNARTLQGFTANSLVRTNLGASGGTVIAPISTFQTIARTGINLPAPGFVIVTGTVSFVSGASGTNNSEVAARLVDVNGGIASYNQFAVVGNTAGAAFEQNIAPTWVFQVPNAGARTFDLEVARTTSSIGFVQAFNGVLSVLYVPFGPGGAIAAEGLPADGFTWAPKP